MGNDIKFEAWHMAALMLGYNQLAKEQDVLGSKVFCRLARDAARKSFLELGGTLESETRDEVILRLHDHVPHVEFGARDIELMRKCVAEHDAKAGVTPENLQVRYVSLANESLTEVSCMPFSEFEKRNAFYSKDVDGNDMRVIEDFYAVSWEAAMQHHHELMGWEPYKADNSIALPSLDGPPERQASATPPDPDIGPAVGDVAGEP